MNRRYWSVSQKRRLNQCVENKSINCPLTKNRPSIGILSLNEEVICGKMNTKNKYNKNDTPSLEQKTTWLTLADNPIKNKKIQCFKQTRFNSKKIKNQNLKRINSEYNKSLQNGAVLPKQTYIDKFSYNSHQGLRDYNEDQVLIKSCIKLNEDKQASLFAVFDGHGGVGASTYLKNNFVQQFSYILKNNYIDLVYALKQALLTIQNKILRMGVKMISGTCALICLIVDDNYYIANVGDSRALMIRNNQNFQEITIDHKPNSPSEYLRIQKNGGQIYRTSHFNQSENRRQYGPFRVNPGKLSVSRTIGDNLIKKKQKGQIVIAEPDIFLGKIKSNQLILLLTDGAYQRFSNQQLSILFSPPNSSLQNNKKCLNSRTNNFINECEKRGTIDNTSIIAIQFSQISLSSKNSLDDLTCPSL